MVIGVKSPMPTTPIQKISAYCPVLRACFAATALAPPFVKKVFEAKKSDQDVCRYA